MTLRKGWLQRQFNRITIDISEWPDCMIKKAGFKKPTEKEVADAKKSLKSIPVTARV